MTVKDKIVIKIDSNVDIENKYPETCDGFQEITRHMYDLFLKKQADYGPSNIGMGKDKIETDDDVEKSMIGLAVRMNDKVQRLLNLVLNKRDPNNESLNDNLIDIANYAVMALLVRGKEWGK